MQKGFSLLELLVVLAIMGMLSAALIPNLAGAQTRAREAAVRTLLYNVQAEVEGYYLDNNFYPAGEALPLAQLSGIMAVQPYRNPFTGRDYLAGDTAGRIIYSLNAGLGEYTLTAYKKDGATVLLELTNG
ncbi:MAG: prepilin-type N-terminal cleavage/methylation domain-containing protein [Candidatus Margulisbacteria bacterium]|jgi:prepilin-type N-terminal cleavage/methylation domain-containing protein|nr:prepilin-type N-terminal cleavage/methylation domain-containing protein [Candidatus Margulisiibacteriota bacterium]